ncbi:MAG TPA: peptide-N4-asparagine amidase, partial [Trebonia sp.]|nr:peptide-N4-asparagine amidase [Trebonia sp.]
MLPLSPRRLARLLVAGAAALMLVWAATSSAPASAATRPTLTRPTLSRPALTSASSSSYVEGDISTPVVGTPAVPRPHTKSCTVSLANDFPSNDAAGNAQNFTGTYTPPRDCPGPWAKVVLDFSATVAGRQYDRSASIEVGNTTIW